MNLDPINRPSMEQRILDNLDTVVLLFDAELKLRYINSAGEMMFSLSARHIIGQNASDLDQCPLDLIDLNLKRAMEFGHPFTERGMFLPLPGGREVTVDCTVIPIGTPAIGTPATGAPHSVKEILVQIQQMDRQLRINREEQLLAQHQAAQALIRGLAHEIKNPLGGLRGAAQLLERELPDQSLWEYTKIIIDEADRLQSLVDRMLGPVRLPDAKHEVSIHQVLERVRHLVQAEIGMRVMINRDYDPSIPPLIADTDQLIQALLNIVRNGARAAAEGGGQMCLRTRILQNFTIGSQRYRLVAQVDVIDNGPGISPDLQNRIFYPMVSDSKGGVGLGLSIAQSLINQYRGLIECRSKAGETVFTVLLPVGDENGERL